MFLMNDKIIFMGSPKVAAETLDGLVKAGIKIDTVITRPDKPQGRSGELRPTPVKILAQKFQIPVFEPKNKAELVETVQKIQPDLAIVVAFGMILPQEALDIPKFGMINIHYSLLPKYRGAAPYIDAILNGDKETGVTLSKIVLELDAGDIIDQKRINLTGNETTESLLSELTKIGTKMLISDLPKYLKGEIELRPQIGTPSFTKMIKKEDGRVDWTNETAEEIERKSRAYSPWPGLYSFWNNKKIDFYDLKVNLEEQEPGKVMVRDGNIIIGTKKGSVLVGALKIEGKNKVTAEEFLRGYPNIIDAIFA